MGSRKKFEVSNYNTNIDKDDSEFWEKQFVRTVTDTEKAVTTHVRTNIFTEQEFLDFKRDIETNSKTVFRVEKTTLTSRCVWSKVYRCHHGTHFHDGIYKLKSVNPRKKIG